jgi:cleavage and polyadenylation specificity factor subunit 3
MKTPEGGIKSEPETESEPEPKLEPELVEKPDADGFTESEHRELARLHALGIPVPGLEIRVDKMVARVWLETLEVVCGHRALRDRVVAVVERGCEIVAPLWG